MPPKLGILAGGGELPGRLIEACRATGRECFVVAIKDNADPAVIGDAPQFWFGLTGAGAAAEALRERGIEDLVIVGRVRRPSLSELKNTDAWTAKLVAKVAVKLMGDDGLLTALVRHLEQEGFHVIGPDDVVGDLVAGEGPIGGLEPDADARLDIERGIAVVRALGTADVGQAVVVQQGIVLGVEAIEGTDALLDRCCTLAREGPGGVLIKCSKPHQERRVDLPTIGPVTVEKAAEAGLRGIAIEAGRSLVIDKREVATAADRAGLFVIGVRVPW